MERYANTWKDDAEDGDEFGSATRSETFREEDSETAQHISVFGKTLVFKGELVADEDLLIQGRIQGSIKHNASNLTIGVHGNAKANIGGRKIIVQGKVQGDIRASESIVIEASAHVHGNLFAPRISLKDGAKFNGSIDMDVDATVDANAIDRNTKQKSSSKETKQPAAATGSKDLSEAKIEELLE